MKLQFITPLAELRPYINKIWIFECEDDFPSGERSLIVPNATTKITIPYKNALTTTDNGKTSICKEDNICFIGVRDVPVNLGAPPGASGSIGIELSTSGSYKFSRIPMHELANNLFKGLGFQQIDVGHSYRLARGEP